MERNLYDKACIYMNTTYMQLQINKNINNSTGIVGRQYEKSIHRKSTDNQ